jgi:large subunit ribosomal protein L30
MATVRITQRRSRNGANPRQRDTLRALGLRRIGHTVEREDSPQLRGMVHRVRHLVRVEGAAAEGVVKGKGAKVEGAKVEGA